MKIHRVAASALAALLIAVSAQAAGIYQGYPSAVAPLTGNELSAFDTTLANGLNPQTEQITVNQLKTYDRAVVALTDAATISADQAVSSFFTVTLGGNRTINVANPQYGNTIRFALTQDATGSRTVTWQSIFKWAAGTAPTLSTAAGKVDYISCFVATTTFLQCTSSLDVR